MILSPPILNQEESVYNIVCFLNLFLTIKLNVKCFLKFDALNDIKHKVFLFDEHAFLRHNYFIGGKVDIILDMIKTP